MYPIARYSPSGLQVQWILDFSLDIQSLDEGVSTILSINVPGVRNTMVAYANARDPYAQDYVVAAINCAEDTVWYYVANVSRGNGATFDDPCRLVIREAFRDPAEI